ncbi:MAG: adenosylcobinamide-phosphate synthase [Proteobacteria bacterium]|nr:adenosylcobinamide-phosphate synthase [Pseudomonadota bacterium]
MTLLALILTLVLEQFRPLNAARYLYPLLSSLGQYFEDRFNDGQVHHGTIAWCLMVLPPVVMTAVFYLLLFALHPLAALLFNVVVLYYTMGFRHSSHFFTRIHASLRAQDLGSARKLIGEWRGHLHDQSGTEEIVRLTLEQGIIGAHRQVFGVIVCFVLLPGPCGAVLYRMAEYYAREWGQRSDQESGDFGRFARQAFFVIEWLPARLTAMAFSVVGDFEDAAYCWRTQSPLWPNLNEGILLAVGAGALGVRLGQPIIQSGEPLERPELGTGDDAEVECLQRFVGLVRRTLVLNALVLLLLSLSRLAA